MRGRAHPFRWPPSGGRRWIAHHRGHRLCPVRAARMGRVRRQAQLRMLAFRPHLGSSSSARCGSFRPCRRFGVFGGFFSCLEVPWARCSCAFLAVEAGRPGLGVVGPHHCSLGWSQNANATQEAKQAWLIPGNLQPRHDCRSCFPVLPKPAAFQWMPSRSPTQPSSSRFIGYVCGVAGRVVPGLPASGAAAAVRCVVFSRCPPVRQKPLRVKVDGCPSACGPGVRAGVQLHPPRESDLPCIPA